MGTLDDDMGNLSFQRGFSLLNEDIMALVDQVRPDYERGDVILDHKRKLLAIQEKLRLDNHSGKIDDKYRYPNPVRLLAIGSGVERHKYTPSKDTDKILLDVSMNGMRSGEFVESHGQI